MTPKPRTVLSARVVVVPESPNVKEYEKYIRRDTLIGDVVKQWPDAAPIMLSYGLHCVGCHISGFETVEQGCMGHGMPPEMIDELMQELNEFAQEQTQEAKDD